MAARLDKIVVIDVESTCWEGHPPPGEMSEIIEVGVCTLDLVTLQRGERRGILVQPQRSQVSAFCTRLTTLTQEAVNRGVMLAEAVRILIDEYASQERLFASWGDYDRNQFQRNCRAYDLHYPFGPTHLNVKTLFAISLGLTKEVGIDDALAKYGLPLEGTHHRGVDDAWNAAHALALLLKRLRRVP
jgi:inhibitor of KinA sporulation pathway (predicted exonuclease)